MNKIMETDKYYTPELDEFHIGFEFEIIDYSSNNYEKDKSTCTWDKSVLKREDIFSAYKEDSYFETVVSYLNNNHVRVKYLDREDIQSLGFEYDRERCGSNFYKKLDDIRFLEI